MLAIAHEKPAAPTHIHSHGYYGLLQDSCGDVAWKAESGRIRRAVFSSKGL